MCSFRHKKKPNAIYPCRTPPVREKQNVRTCYFMLLMKTWCKYSVFTLVPGTASPPWRSASLSTYTSVHLCTWSTLMSQACVWWCDTRHDDVTLVGPLMQMIYTHVTSFPFVLIWVLPVYTSRPSPPPLPHFSLQTESAAHSLTRDLPVPESLYLLTIPPSQQVPI